MRQRTTSSTDTKKTDKNLNGQQYLLGQVRYTYFAIEVYLTLLSKYISSEGVRFVFLRYLPSLFQKSYDFKKCQHFLFVMLYVLEILFELRGFADSPHLSTSLSL